MKKILIVEDEDNISLALKTIIEKGVDKSQVFTATNGLEALEYFNEHNIDLILSDWNMPVMTGGELLTAIREGVRNTHVPFLMLTARADADSVKLAIDHHITEYIVKPFDKKDLLKKITTAIGGGDDLDGEQEYSQATVFHNIMSLVKTRMAKGYLKFPVLSAIGMKAVDLINRDDNSIEELIRVIKPDQSISSKIMSVANSSFYRGQVPIETLESALTRIGLKETGNIVLAYSLKELFTNQQNDFSERLNYLWEHSLTTAIIAKKIGQMKKSQKIERLYAAALFHDIGKLLLIPVLIELKKKRDDIDNDLVDEILSALHVNVGIDLLKHWSFSRFFIEVIKEHHSVDNLNELAADIRYIMLANQLSKIIHDKHLDEELEKGVVAKLASSVGVNRADISELLKETSDQVLQFKMFFRR